MLWCDNHECLKLIRLNESQLQLVKPEGDAGLNLELQMFIVKNEKSDLIKAYVKRLINETITETRNPFLFNIAVANIKQSMKDSPRLGTEILNSLESISKDSYLKSILQM